MKGNNPWIMAVLATALLICFAGIFVMGIIHTAKAPAPLDVYIIGIESFPVAAPPHVEEKDIPVQYVVRYVLSGRLEEIALYSRTDAEALIAWLGERKK